MRRLLAWLILLVPIAVFLVCLFIGVSWEEGLLRCAVVGGLVAAAIAAAWALGEVFD